MNRDEITEFDPTTFSKEECHWLLENLDKPPVVALRSIRSVREPMTRMNKNGVIYPDGVNPNAVRPFLERVQQLEQLQQHEGLRWVGKDAIRQAIQRWLDVDAKWELDHKRTRGKAPRYPSLYSFDSKGRAFRGGPGSDSGKIRTYFDEKGERKPLTLPLIPEDVVEWVPGFTEAPSAGLVVNDAAKRIECFCGHTEAFKEGSRASFNAARARMSKHLRKSTEEVERHREVHLNEFGQASV